MMNDRAVPKATCIVALLIAASFADAAEGRKIADIEFARPGIIDMALDLYLPEDAPKPLPLVVWIHGGGFRQGSKDKRRINWLLEHGYATANISYRLSNIAPFPAQIHDCKGAIRWLRAHASEYGIDATRIAVVGHSAGAALAMLLGTSAGDAYLEGTVGGNVGVSSSVQAVICISGTVDYVRRFQGTEQMDAEDSMFARFLGGRPRDHVEQMKRASSINYVTPDDPPAMIMHGQKETPSHFTQAKLLHEVYRKNGLDSVYVVARGAAHNDLDLMFNAENRKLALGLLKRASSSASAKPTGTSAPSPVAATKKAAQALPVPERFRDIDPARIRQYLPRRHSKRLPPFIKAPDAELGYAAIVDKPDMPFHFGFHQGDNAPRAVSALSTLPEGTKAKWVRTGNSGFGLRRELATAEIVPGKYHIYRLAEIEVTPNCQIWFSSSSWQTRLQVGSRLYELGANNRWEAYVSMKFDGPTYGGTGADTVLCDRVILLRRDARDTRPGTSKPAHPQEQQ